MGKPSARRIKSELKELRKIIESTECDITKRLAQVAEDSIRWVVEDTEGWDGPVRDVENFANLLNNEIVHSR